MKNIEVAAAIIKGEGEHEGTIFCAQRGYGEFKDFWEFPGGKLKDGESAKEALERELYEELHAKVNAKGLYDVIEFDYPQRHVKLYFYICTLKDKTLDLLEHENARWVKYADLMSLNWLPADLSLIEKLQKDFLSKQDKSRSFNFDK